MNFRKNNPQKKNAYILNKLTGKLPKKKIFFENFEEKNRKTFFFITKKSQIFLLQKKQRKTCKKRNNEKHLTQTLTGCAKNELANFAKTFFEKNR